LRWDGVFLRKGQRSLAYFHAHKANFGDRAIPSRVKEDILTEMESLAQEMDPIYREMWESKRSVIEGAETEWQSFPSVQMNDTDYLLGYFDRGSNMIYLSGVILELGPKNIAESLFKEILFGPKKVAVIGASGFAGQEIYLTLSAALPEVIGTRHSYLRGGLQVLDLNKQEDIKEFLERENPDVVIYAAGIADPDKALMDPETADNLNVAVPEFILNQWEGQFVYLSSDYVFSGEHPPYNLDSEMRPINYYGETKRRGEQAVLENPGNIVVRMGVLYGESRKGKETFLESVIRQLDMGETIKADDERIRHPLWTRDVARVILKQLSEESQGILMINGTESLTQKEWAEEIAAIYFQRYPYLLPEGETPESYSRHQVQPMPSRQDGQKALRPENTQMDNSVAHITALKDATEEMIPALSQNEDIHFICRKMVGALESGDEELFLRLGRVVQDGGMRWAIVGKPVSRGSGWEIDTYPHENIDELVGYLMRGVTIRNPVTYMRTITALKSAAVTIDREKQGVIFFRDSEVSDKGLEIYWLGHHPIKAGQYQVFSGFVEMMRVSGRSILVNITDKIEEHDQPEKYPLRFDLQGGSYSQVTRLIYMDGSTRIEKRADKAKDGGKLLREARYIQDLASPFSPAIYEIHDGEETVVIMEDIPGVSLSTLIDRTDWESFSTRGGKNLVSPFQMVQSIYQSLLSDFYSVKVSETPKHFFREFHEKKLISRWTEAARESPLIASLLDAPYLEFGHLEGGLFPNLPLMLRIAKLVDRIHPRILRPPYLSKEHGDLHSGNILVDPYFFLLDGTMSHFWLIDHKYMASGNEPLYDFAKLIHNYYGHYDMALLHNRTYSFGLRQSADGGMRFSLVYDDEAGGTIDFMGTINDFTREFGHFLSSGKSESFPFEENSVFWPIRLLWTHATLMAGLLPFHILNNEREEKVSIIYERSVVEFKKTLDIVFKAMSSTRMPVISRILKYLWDSLEVASEKKDRKKYHATINRIVSFLEIYSQYTSLKSMVGFTRDSETFKHYDAFQTAA